MEDVKCNLCGAQDAGELYTVHDWYWFNGGPFTIVCCHRCDLVYLNPRPTSQELDQFNQSMWNMWSVSDQSVAHIGSPELARDTHAEILRDLGKLNPKTGRLLEIGSGQGGFLKLLEQKGWEVHGIDISAECTAYAQDVHGLNNVMIADLLDADLDGDFFDIVVMNHVIEHLPDPKSYLDEVYRVLKPGGVLCISTPNIDSLQARVFGEYWRALSVPLHLVLFSPNTLSEMLAETGYSVITISHFSKVANAYTWLLSMSCVVKLGLQKLSRPFQAPGDMKLPEGIGHSRREPRARRWFRRLRPVLTTLVSPIIYFESAVKRGATITVYATPKEK
ncbi:class I SAM-dependent methyltransferase [Chloroflexota bacterium]